MLQYFRFEAEIQDTKTIVSFTTFDGVRVDISKKFLKHDKISNRWYFNKMVINPRTGNKVEVKTYITMGDVYIVQCPEQVAVGAFDDAGTPRYIYSATDLISFQEVSAYRGTHNAEETYRS